MYDKIECPNTLLVNSRTLLLTKHEVQFYIELKQHMPQGVDVFILAYQADKYINQVHCTV